MTTDNVTPLKTDNAKIIREAQENHGDVVVFDTEHGLAIFKRPDLVNYERFTDAVAGDASTSAAARTLCNSCVVCPDQQAFKEIVTRIPALPLRVTKQLHVLAGASVEGEIKKA